MTTKTFFFIGAAIQLTAVALLALISSLGISNGPVICIIVMLGLMALLFLKKNKFDDVKKFNLMILAWSFIYILVFQTVGFLWFPGLVKDLTPFTLEQMIRGFLIFLSVAVLYLTEFIMLKLFSRKIKKN